MSSHVLLPLPGYSESSEAQNKSRPSSSRYPHEHNNTLPPVKHTIDHSGFHHSLCEPLSYMESPYPQRDAVRSHFDRPIFGTTAEHQTLYMSTPAEPETPRFRLMYEAPRYYPTLEPRMLFYGQPSIYEQGDPSSYMPASQIQAPDSPPSPYFPLYDSREQHGPYFDQDVKFSPVSSETSLYSAASKATDDDDGDDDEEDRVEDKPYAKLIYDALLKAPGHRMMLRDIYEWFIKNTNKPRESGSNGWQNSIRHNLSMNQAFENDKSEPSSRGQPRKANSVWVLTQSAIDHGVQSTTRYRKSTSFKKSHHQRASTTERQKSGSKGGKAARRAALVRRQELCLRRKTSPGGAGLDEMPLTGWPDGSASPSEQVPGPGYCPTSPTDDQCQTPAPEWAQSPVNIDMSTCMPHEYDPQTSGQALHQLCDPMFEHLQKFVYDVGTLNSLFA